MSPPAPSPALAIPLLCALLGAAAGYGLGSRASSPPSAPPVVRIEAPSEAGGRGEQARGPLAAWQDHFVQPLAGDRLALYRLVPPATGTSAASLALVTVYALRNDQNRHLHEPQRYVGHGQYLDDLDALARAALAQAKSAFEALERASDVRRETGLAMEAHARELLQLGDASFLTAKLREEGTGYMGRRAAALALGEAGFLIACPALAELMAEPGDVGPRAQAVLGRFAGRPITSSAAFEAWWASVPAARRYAREAPTEEKAP